MHVDFYRHDVEPSAVEAIAQVIANPFLTSGPVGREVEKQFAAYFGVRHALLVSSWTSGATAALLAIGVGPGDEVIVPAMTFVATANVVEILGARPVFVDVDSDTLLLTQEGIARAVTPQTKAVIPVHLYGQMMDIAAIHDRPDIAIIEDSAHCFEGSNRIRLAPEQAMLYRRISEAINESCKSFITLPALNSFYLWTGQDPPSHFNVGFWTALFDDRLQDSLSASSKTLIGFVCSKQRLRELLDEGKSAKGWAASSIFGECLSAYCGFRRL